MAIDRRARRTYSTKLALVGDIRAQSSVYLSPIRKVGDQKRQERAERPTIATSGPIARAISRPATSGVVSAEAQRSFLKCSGARARATCSATRERPSCSLACRILRRLQPSAGRGGPPVRARPPRVSMGLPAHRIDRAAEIAPALEAAISSGAPNLIEIPISPS